ncbi:MAG: hypothetical protein O3C10_00760 [Chloroflexi bacterium]|nr:hypothetical protein [Chloroflexota bacterium]
MVNAETKMSEATSTDDQDVFVLGARSGNAFRLLPIFRDTALAIESDIADWDAIDVPIVTSDYHSLIREVMSQRLAAMRVGITALQDIAAGNSADDPLTQAESAMDEANEILRMAVDEAKRIKG